MRPFHFCANKRTPHFSGQRPAAVEARGGDVRSTDDWKEQQKNGGKEESGAAETDKESWITTVPFLLDMTKKARLQKRLTHSVKLFFWWSLNKYPDFLGERKGKSAFVCPTHFITLFSRSLPCTTTNVGGVRSVAKYACNVFVPGN